MITEIHPPTRAPNAIIMTPMKITIASLRLIIIEKLYVLKTWKVKLVSVAEPLSDYQFGKSSDFYYHHIEFKNH